MAWLTQATQMDQRIRIGHALCYEFTSAGWIVVCHGGGGCAWCAVPVCGVGAYAEQVPLEYLPST
jgi:hypothetical protein